MKFFFTALAILSSMVSSLSASGATDTVLVREPDIPILIDRIDNELFHLRIDAREAKVLNSIILKLGEDVSGIKAVKLYYSGTDNINRAGQLHFTPVEYISRSDPGNTLCANRSYSILKDSCNVGRSRQVSLKANQNLFQGINYFWISIQMKDRASLLTKIQASVSEILIDGKKAEILYHQKTGFHRIGIGVRHAGDDGAKAYRIPGMTKSNKGTLLAVYDVRYNNSVDLQEHIDIGLSRSTNGGKKWDKMRIPLSFSEFGGLPKAQNGIGDPAILTDKKTGTIWIIAAWTHGMGNGRAWFNSRQGMDLNHTAQLILTKSDDDGKTWSEPINITRQVKDSSWFFLLQGPGNGISMQDGTLVFAAQYIGADRMPCACIIYSKDHGDSWQISKAARTNTTESQVVELEPGLLMLNMRDNRGGSRAIATTKDMGRTWQEHISSRSALPEPVCMASLINVPAAENIMDKDILLFSNPNSTSKRNNITIKASLDKGMTWPVEYQVLLDEGESWGYTSLCMVDRENIGILYESSVSHMTFQVVSLKDLLGTDF